MNAPDAPAPISHNKSARSLLFGTLGIVLGALALVALSTACVSDTDDDMNASDDPAAYTQAYVSEAIDRYAEDGHVETVEYYNSEDSIDGQWYLFVADESGDLIIHGANQDLVGTPLEDVVGENSYPSGQLVSDIAAEGGGWSEYVFYNPETNRAQVKHSWLDEHAGLTFGSGWYEDGPSKSDASAYAQSLVRQAINLYDASGIDEAVAYYNDPVSVDGQWYVFIVDTETGRMIGHYNPDLRAQDPDMHIDAVGYFYGDELRGAPEGGRWLNYVIRNPETGQDARKNTWAILHDGYIFSSGWYE